MIINKLYHIAACLLLLTASVSCHPIEEWDNDPAGNFEALWTILYQNYCLFAEKQID